MKNIWSAFCWKRDVQAKGEDVPFSWHVLNLWAYRTEYQKQALQRTPGPALAKICPKYVSKHHHQNTEQLFSLHSPKPEVIMSQLWEGFSYADSASYVSYLSFTPRESLQLPHHSTGMICHLLSWKLTWPKGAGSQTVLLSLPSHERDLTHYSSSQWHKRLQIWHLLFPQLQNQLLKAALPTLCNCLVLLCPPPISVLLPFAFCLGGQVASTGRQKLVQKLMQITFWK